MKKQRIDSDFDDFYSQCLKELKARDNYTDAFIPLLERYCTLTAKLNKLNSEIVDTEIVTNHTNKIGATNEASSPSWRMFLALNQEANRLARQLKLCPESAPKNKVDDADDDDYNLTMKVAK
jgi:hypothetical protein